MDSQVDHNNSNADQISPQSHMAQQFPVGDSKPVIFWDPDRDPYGYKRFPKLLTVFNKPKSKLTLPSSWTVALASLVVLAMCGWKMYKANPQATEPFVFVEVRALDTFGRPVAGAEVKFNDKAMGLTDSFGEWRRLLKLRLGVAFPLEILKRVSNEEIRATKVIRLPNKVVDQRNIELRISVRLDMAPKGLSNASPSSPRSRQGKATSAADVSPRSNNRR